MDPHSGNLGRLNGPIGGDPVGGIRLVAAAIQGFITQIEQVALGLGSPVKVGGGIFNGPGGVFLGPTIGEFPPLATA
jgi:hypothetical protein